MPTFIFHARLVREGPVRQEMSVKLQVKISESSAKEIRLEVSRPEELEFLYAQVITRQNYKSLFPIDQWGIDFENILKRIIYALKTASELTCYVTPDEKICVFHILYNIQDIRTIIAVDLRRVTGDESIPHVKFSNKQLNREVEKPTQNEVLLNKKIEELEKSRAELEEQLRTTLLKVKEREDCTNEKESLKAVLGRLQRLEEEFSADKLKNEQTRSELRKTEETIRVHHEATKIVIKSELRPIFKSLSVALLERKKENDQVAQKIASLEEAFEEFRSNETDFKKSQEELEEKLKEIYEKSACDETVASVNGRLAETIEELELRLANHEQFLLDTQNSLSAEQAKSAELEIENENLQTLVEELTAKDDQNKSLLAEYEEKLNKNLNEMLSKMKKYVAIAHTKAADLEKENENLKTRIDQLMAEDEDICSLLCELNGKLGDRENAVVKFEESLQSNSNELVESQKSLDIEQKKSAELELELQRMSELCKEGEQKENDMKEEAEKMKENLAKMKITSKEVEDRLCRIYGENRGLRGRICSLEETNGKLIDEKNALGGIWKQRAELENSKKQNERLKKEMDYKNCRFSELEAKVLQMDSDLKEKCAELDQNKNKENVTGPPAMPYIQPKLRTVFNTNWGAN